MHYKDKVWPPAPSKLHEHDSPQERRSSVERLGSRALCFSATATASSLLYTALIVVESKMPLNNIESDLALFLFALQCISFALFVVGLSFGIAGRRSWQGMIGISLAVVSPAWLLIWFIVYGMCDPWHP